MRNPCALTIRRAISESFMRIEYIAQPDVQFGRVITKILEEAPLPRKIVFVSAFVSLQTVVRLKPLIAKLQKSGATIRFVLGIDLGGTSVETLKEIHSWNIDTLIVKHRIPKHTFHPKMYLFEWDNRAEIIIGSNNITEGGFFGNYEGCARIIYDLHSEQTAYQTAQQTLTRFIEPHGPIVYTLTDIFMKKLIDRGEIPSESVAKAYREARYKATVTPNRTQKSLFGFEEIPSPPPLPLELLERLIGNVRKRRKTTKTSRKKHPRPNKQTSIISSDENILNPAAFYMTLPTLQGPNIPGEGRIPLEAIELAQEFWGWPDEYIKNVSPRKGKNRVYWNWRPKWKVFSIEHPDKISIQTVRMYMYENSSDFRFYARPLVNTGADLGDIVQIRRIADDEAEFECVISRKGTPQYSDWIKFCNQKVTNSTRVFGYA